MSGRARRRREAQRRARERREEQRPERAAQEGGAPAAPGPGRPARRRTGGRGGLWERVSRVRVSPWLVAMPVLAAGAVIVVVLILTSGSSGTSVGSVPTPTPDPRVAGQTPVASFAVEAGGSADNAFFRPNRITAKAGDVIELVVTNTGSVTHNLRVSGLDKEYDTADDFEMPPNVIKPGETQRLVVKIDPPPDTYPFRCDFHPLIQTGTLVLR